MAAPYAAVAMQILHLRRRRSSSVQEAGRRGLGSDSPPNSQNLLMPSALSITPVTSRGAGPKRLQTLARACHRRLPPVVTFHSGSLALCVSLSFTGKPTRHFKRSPRQALGNPHHRRRCTITPSPVIPPESSSRIPNVIPETFELDPPLLFSTPLTPT